ncbi:MAG: glycoside hydrolase family 15 [Prosthecochloris sp.]|nr:glycoside hydrolase family 15 [Prosthecochloris sp.]
MYREIADYGLIGDMHSVALVSGDGSIDYCSLPFLDSPTVFASLLDDEKGGFFSIRPKESFTSSQQYVQDTNVLVSTFKNDDGQADLYDFMPVATRHLVTSKEHRIDRCLEMKSGILEFELAFMPRPDYAKTIPVVTCRGNRISAFSHEQPLTLIHSLQEYRVRQCNSGIVVIDFSLSAEQSARFSLIYGDATESVSDSCSLEKNIEFWKNWLHNCMGEHCAFLGEYTQMVNRSLLALKLLTFHPTGAIAAAGTTSLPEAIGGERNWDYRFTWLRDASFTLKAFFSLGHITEADGFIRWLHATYRKHEKETIRIMYSIRGKEMLHEKELSHLKGYKNSTPVRIGNLAHKQNQWDIYGEVMDAALRLSDYAGKIDEELWPFFRDICTMAMKNWQKPDDGIWEVRNGPCHFVYSKVMCWVALDRGIIIANRYGFDAPVAEWIEERETIKTDILEKGFNRDLKSFVQRYGSLELDASLLLLPLANFLPINDERIQGTINACKKELLHDGFLSRYIADDGLDGEEGAFVLCNFWLIECLARSDRIEEAEKLMKETLHSANRLGLFSEEFNSSTGELLGNFPQAFSHIGYINAVSAILNARGRSFEEEAKTTLADKLSKILPFQANLNDGPETADATDTEIAVRLKKLLGKLQGAFFNVSMGRVNYQAMKQSERFREYQQLAVNLRSFSPESLGNDNEKKAFWINIYNILIIHGVIEFDIRNSVLEIINFFGRIGYTIGNTFFSPDDIEHGILRKNRHHPAFMLRPFSPFDSRLPLMVETFDPRIHFALVCASSSCPPIEFYDPEHIDDQLDIATRSFIIRRGIETDSENNTVRLSEIFKWYQHDFGKDKTEALSYIAEFANEKTRQFILKNPGKLKVEYLPYNWNLNSTLE